MPYYPSFDLVLTDGTDTSKELDFDVSLVSAATRRTLKSPNLSGTLALIDGAQTFTALQTFKDTTFKVVDDADATKTLVFSLGGASANADLTLAWVGTADRTVTIPEMGANFTLAGLIAQTFTQLQTITSNAGCLVLTPNPASTAVVVNVDSGSSGIAFSIFDELSGFSTTIQPNSGILSDIALTLPVGSGNLVTTSSTDTLNNKTLGVTGVLRTDSVTSGTHWRDVNVSTKRLYTILSGAVGSSTFTLANTAARNYTFGNYSGYVAVPVNEGTLGKVLVSAGAGAQPTWNTTVSAGTATVDFLTGLEQVTLTVSDATVSAGSVITALVGLPADGREADELEMDQFAVSVGTIVASTSFVLVITCLTGYAHGTFTVNYIRS